jgi:3-dehydroquinate dehydratase-2
VEGVIVDAFHAHMDDVQGAIVNAAGLSFSSVSIHDAIKAMPFPTIEVHISNLATRDEIHRHSILTPAVRGTVMGLGWRSYTTALRALIEIVREERAAKH